MSLFTNRHSSEIGLHHVPLYGFSKSGRPVEVLKVPKSQVGVILREFLASLVQCKCHCPDTIIGEANVGMSYRVIVGPVGSLWVVLKLLQITLILLFKYFSGGLKIAQAILLRVCPCEGTV